ncbi:carbamoyltransferase C-terminal domain-containing protein [Desulfovibrio sp. UCD-KL4C]|uniref:carbamoyltransferase C-terminal domain-containing protein n=1 Tax=Desulfovibrio sp. UCD-KL4C TaxID=2578120 RepID=UPI0025B8D1CF|nr:carbamoyltransferase C-terminal domain-containing protein [Desulfovibrio sp. UCD-KL4C]
MKLGLHIGHDATACLINNKITAIAEERVTRIKNYTGFPFQAIAECLKNQDVTLDEISEIVIAGTSSKNMRSYRPAIYFEKISADFSNEVSPNIRLKALMHFFDTETIHTKVEKYFRESGYKGDIKYVDHHLAHVASSYATYPIENAVMLSLDGGGDGINWSIYSTERDSFKKLACSQKINGVVHDSPADVYANVTKLLGFKRNRHEGKLTGLAARGKPLAIDYFRQLLRFEEGQFVCRLPYAANSLSKKLSRYGRFISSGIIYHTKMINDMKEDLQGFTKEDIASSLQKWFEEIILEFLSYYSGKFNLKGKQLLLSGGAFANVLLNQRIKNAKLFENVSVVPNMGDGGLALGAAYLALDSSQKDKLFRKKQKNVYYGPEYTKEEIDIAITRAGLNAVELKESAATFAAKALSKQYIIGFFNKGMEYGPRALGARSIIANPADNTINESINKRLNRTEFMPFAPFILDEDADRCLKDYDPCQNTANFMTITYNVKEIMQKKASAVVHIDGTARPQIVSRNENNLYYDILKEFRDLTGIPTLVNTSFNSHEEPIVMSPQDALNSYKIGTVDILMLGETAIMSEKIKKDLGI